MQLKGTSFYGHRRHLAAVRRTMAGDIESGRIVVLNATVRFQNGLADAVVVIERALDRTYPEWRENPLEHLTNFRMPRPDWIYLTQIREKVYQGLEWDPKEFATRAGEWD